MTPPPIPTLRTWTFLSVVVLAGALSACGMRIPFVEEAQPTVPAAAPTAPAAAPTEPIDPGTVESTLLEAEARLRNGDPSGALAGLLLFPRGAPAPLHREALARARQAAAQLDGPALSWVLRGASQSAPVLPPVQVAYARLLHQEGEEVRAHWFARAALDGGAGGSDAAVARAILSGATLPVPEGPPPARAPVPERRAPVPEPRNPAAVPRNPVAVPRNPVAEPERRGEPEPVAPPREPTVTSRLQQVDARLGAGDPAGALAELLLIPQDAPAALQGDADARAREAAGRLDGPALSSVLRGASPTAPVLPSIQVAYARVLHREGEGARAQWFARTALDGGARGGDAATARAILAGDPLPEAEEPTAREPEEPAPARPESPPAAQPADTAAAPEPTPPDSLPAEPADTAAAPEPTPSDSLPAEPADTAPEPTPSDSVPMPADTAASPEHAAPDSAVAPVEPDSVPAAAPEPADAPDPRVEEPPEPAAPPVPDLARRGLHAPPRPTLTDLAPRALPSTLAQMHRRPASADGTSPVFDIPVGVARATPVTLGALLPMSGSPALRQYAVGIREGIEAAFAAATLPKTVSLDIRDDAAEGGTAAVQLRSLQEGSLMGVVGPLQEGLVRSTAAARSRDVVMVSPTAADVADLPGVYSLASPDPGAARALAGYAMTSGLEQVVVLHPVDDRWTFEAAAFRDAFRELGGSLLRTLTYEPGATDFQDQLRTVEALKPQALVLPVPAEDIEALAPQVSFFGLDTLGIRVLGTADWSEDMVLRGVSPRHMNGVVVATPQRPGAESEGYLRFKNAYEQHFRRSLRDDLPALGYDAASLLIRALASGARTPDALGRAMEAIEGFEGATGTLSIEDGRIVREHHLVCVQDAALVDIRPGELPFQYRPMRRGDPARNEPERIPLGPVERYCPGNIPPHATEPGSPIPPGR